MLFHRPVRRDDLLAVAALVVPWAALVLMVDPRGDVSLLDDWCYAISVERILQGKGFAVSPWSSTFPAVQIWWGTLFAWLGGFSYTTLRWSTLVLWLFGTVGAYGFLRALGCRVRAALFGAAALALYPNMFVLAFTFMTDIAFIALSIVSLWALVAGLRSARQSTIVLGLAVAVGAFFVRPVAIAVPAGLFLGALVLGRPELRFRNAALSVATIVVMVVASTAATRLFPWAGDGGVQYRVMRLSFIFMVPPMVYVEAALSMLAHVGLAAVPVLIAFGPAPRR
jgi:4-amino-4-deoxy-L-arabinose transferase-like glycosyltransferase